MELQIKTKKRLFVAYPWNIYIQSVYEEDVFTKLFEEWEIRHGSNVTLKDSDSSEVEKFMNRNKHLYDIFASAIEKSDFFIADVTGTNPNVMLELGIAIQLNKNVLIVTSDELGKLPFDISGFRVSRYKSKEELIKIIEDELRVFTKIKSQNFIKYFPEFHFSFPSEGELKHGHAIPLPIPRNIKNLRLRIEYKFVTISNSHDWLGIHLRAQIPDIIKSELVYIRQNKKLESVSFPGRRTPVIGKELAKKNLETKDGFKLLELIIEENSLRAITPDSELEDNGLQNENLGGIVLHAFAHNPPTLENLSILYRNLEVISLDTTAPKNG
jgi:hypothetical protein